MLEVVLSGEKYDFDRLRSVFGVIATDFLLEGLVGPCYQETYSIFQRHAKDRAGGFMRTAMRQIRRQPLTEEEKEWFKDLKDFFADLKYYKSRRFLKDSKKGTKAEQEVFRNRLIVGIAKKIDKINGKNAGTMYLEQEMSQYRVNVDGCMVPIALIREEDLWGGI